jgi:hypothetical protein
MLTPECCAICDHRREDHEAGCTRCDCLEYTTPPVARTTEGA